jgi:large subunit ribosomal protein L10
MVQPQKKQEGKEERTQIVESLRKQFEEVQGGVLADFRGLNVEQISDLRRRFREVGAKFKVVKNTLTRIAVKDTSYENLQDILVGPTGVAFGHEDPLATAKVAVEFAKDNEALEVKGGFLEGSVLTFDQLVELSKIPGKEALLAQVLSVFNSPGQKFLGVLNGVPQKFLGVLKAQADKIEGS